jgi:GTPase Era involved in 16S rRNA processing
MMTANSSTGPTRKFLMLQDQRMKKAKLLVLLVTMEEQIKNGKSFILIKLKRQRPRVLMQNSVSTLTDLSILFHNFHSTELLKCLEEPTLF